MGICYGQTDLEVEDTYTEELNEVKKILPKKVEAIFSSPLKRCSQLATDCYPNSNIEFESRLKELDFGKWEMKAWKEISKKTLDEWMADFINNAPPSGESMKDLSDRVLNWFFELQTSNVNSATVFTHAGIIRTLLSHMNDTPLHKAFDLYKVDYGQVFSIRI